MKHRVHWLLDALLIAALFVSGAAIWWLASAPPPVRDTLGGQGAGFDLSLPESRGIAPLSSFRAMVERPLFWAERRPVVSEAPPAAAQAGQLAAYSLVGVLLFDGEGIALLRDRKGKTRKLKQGDTLDGWRLVRLARREAEFQHRGKHEILPLKAGKPVATRAGKRSARSRVNPVRQPRRPATRRQAPHMPVVPQVTTPKAPRTH